MMPQVILEVAFTTDPDSSNPNWRDVSSKLLGGSTQRGRQYELDTVQAGTCTLRLDNGNRDFDPTYTRSRFFPYVVPMRKIRLSAVWAGVTYYLFTGFVERWPISWDTPAWGSVTVTVTDAFPSLSRASISGGFDQETTGMRISDVLSASSWASSTQVPLAGYWTLDTSLLGTTTKLGYSLPTTLIDTGRTTVQAAAIATTDNVDALSHIQDIAAAERGVFFVDGQGRFVFQDRGRRYNATSQVTFTDAQNLTPTRLPYQQLLPDLDVTKVVNDVTVTATPGGAPQNVVDAASQQQNLRRSLSLTPPLTTDGEALDQAGYEVQLHSTPKLRFDQLTVAPQGYDNSWPHTLGRELGDMVTVERTPATTPAIASETITRQCFIESVQHSFTPDSWTTSFQLSPADPYAAFFSLGTGQLDSPTANLAY